MPKPELTNNELLDIRDATIETDMPRCCGVCVRWEAEYEGQGFCKIGDGPHKPDFHASNCCGVFKLDLAIWE